MYAYTKRWFPEYMEMNEKTLPKVILRFQGNELQLVTPFVNNYHLSRKKIYI